MKKSIIFFALLVFIPGICWGGSRILVPIIDAPQDAVDAGVFVPDARVVIALYDYDSSQASGVFIVVENGSVISQQVRSDMVVGQDLMLVEDCETFVLKLDPKGVELIFSCAYPFAVVVANSIDLNLSRSFIEYLQDLGVAVEVVSAEEVEEYKDSATIIILGGPDAPEGVGPIVREVLNEDEQDYLRMKGNGKMFVTDNPWSLDPGKKVSVLAGYDRHETQRVVLESQGKFIV